MNCPLCNKVLLFINKRYSCFTMIHIRNNFPLKSHYELNEYPSFSSEVIISDNYEVYTNSITNLYKIINKNNNIIFDLPKFNFKDSKDLERKINLYLSLG